MILLILNIISLLLITSATTIACITINTNYAKIIGICVLRKKIPMRFKTFLKIIEKDPTHFLNSNKDYLIYGNTTIEKLKITTLSKNLAFLPSSLYRTHITNCPKLKTIEAEFYGGIYISECPKLNNIDNIKVREGVIARKLGAGTSLIAANKSLINIGGYFEGELTIIDDRVETIKNLVVKHLGVTENNLELLCFNLKEIDVVSEGHIMIQFAKLQKIKLQIEKPNKHGVKATFMYCEGLKKLPKEYNPIEFKLVHTESVLKIIEEELKEKEERIRIRKELNRLN